MEPAPQEPEEPLARIDRLLQPLFAEMLLWPVTFCVAAAAATFVASVVLMALRGSLFAGAALLGLVWLSVEPLRAAFARRRLGATAGLVLLLWALAAGIAIVGAGTGFL